MCVSRMFVGQRLQMDQSIKFISLHPGGWSLTSRVPCDSICDVAHPPFLNRNVTMSTDPYFSEPTFSTLDGRLPRSSGVYAVVITPVWDQNSTPVVVYIGSSGDLHDRFARGGIRRHLYKRLLVILKNYKAGICYLETRNYRAIEISMIKKYRPRLNKTYNNG